MNKIRTSKDITDAVNYYGILPFYNSENVCLESLSAVSFNKLWDLRYEPTNNKEFVYGKFWNGKAAFVSLELFPHLAALRRDGYDFDSLADEGRASHSEIVIMNAVGSMLTPSYKLGASLGLKGYDARVAKLQNKTYLCQLFGKSYMGTALIAPPEEVFGAEYTRSKYNLSLEENSAALAKAPGLKDTDPKTLEKLLKPAV